MTAIGDTVTWKTRQFKCTGTGELTKGKVTVALYEWTAACDCGEKYSFKCTSRDFPFASIVRISMNKYIQDFCGKCRYKGRKSSRLADRILDSYVQMVEDILIERSYATFEEIQNNIIEIPIDEYLKKFKSAEVEDAKIARIALRNAAAKKNRGFLNAVMSAGRKKDTFTFKKGHWTVDDNVEIPSRSRDVSTENQIFKVVESLLRYEAMTAAHIADRLQAFRDEMPKNIVAKLRLRDAGRTTNDAVRQILKRMRSAGRAVPDKAGPGGKWYLVKQD
jgi:hypothetical protein